MSRWSWECCERKLKKTVPPAQMTGFLGYFTMPKEFVKLMGECCQTTSHLAERQSLGSDMA